MKATQRQKQFLRALGHKQVDSLSKESASTLIDRLLKEERASGKTFPCPYCKQKFGPRPKRRKKCPACQKTIIHLSGRFHTEAKLDELDQKDWLKESRQENRENVREDWREERSFRKEFKEQHIVGYLLRIGPQCAGSKHLDRVLVLIEDAANAIDLLPPFGSCRHDTCECEFDPVSAREIPKKTRVAEFADPAKQAKLNSGNTSKPVAKASNPGGCATLLFFAVSLVVCSWIAIGFA